MALQKYFYKDSILGTFVIDNDTVSTNTCILDFDSTDTKVRVVSVSTGLTILETIEITNLLDEAGDPYANKAGLLAAVKDFFLSGGDTTNLESITNKDASGGYVGKTLEKINFWNAARTFMSFIVNAATAARTYTFPDRDITVAGTDEIITNTTNSGLAGTGQRMVEASPTGVLSASKTIRTGKLSDSTTINLLIDTANWDINGDYIGTTITGTYEGMYYKTTDYKFEAYSNNEWIRIPKG